MRSTGPDRCRRPCMPIHADNLFASQLQLVVTLSLPVSLLSGLTVLSDRKPRIACSRVSPSSKTVCTSWLEVCLLRHSLYPRLPPSQTTALYPFAQCHRDGQQPIDPPIAQKSNLTQTKLWCQAQARHRAKLKPPDTPFRHHQIANRVTRRISALSLPASALICAQPC